MAIKVRRVRDRPVTERMSIRVPATPENVTFTCVHGPPRMDWRYPKKHA